MKKKSKPWAKTKLKPWERKPKSIAEPYNRNKFNEIYGRISESVS